MTLDLSNNVIAALKDAFSRHYRKNIELKDNDIMFNSGVMLIDLKKWREENIENRIIVFFLKYKGKVQQGDQGVLNAMLSSKTATLSPKFNKDIEGRVKYYYFFLNLIKGNSSKFLVQKFNLISIFRNTFLADELYVQTVLSRFENFDDEYISSSRYID